MASFDDIKKFVSILNKIFKVELNQAPDAQTMQRWANLLPETSKETLLHTAQLIELECVKYPAFAEIVNFVDKVEGANDRDVLDEILKMISRNSSDVTRWPAIEESIYYVITNLGGIQTINHFQEKDLSFKSAEARKLYKQFRAYKRAGIFTANPIIPTNGMRLLANNTPKNRALLEEKRNEVLNPPRPTDWGEPYKPGTFLEEMNKLKTNSKPE